MFQMNLKYREVEQVTEIENSIKVLTEHTQHYVPTEDLEHLYAVIEAAEKVLKYETAEDEGRLVVLPCKVGDTVWVITHPFNVLDDFDFYEDAHDEIYESYISSVTFYEDSNQYRIYTKDFIKAYFMECDFGKSIFLTREEAEKALKEMEGK